MPHDLAKLLRWARDPELAARAEAAARLRDHLDSPDSVAALTRLIQDPAAEVVSHAAASLRALDNPGADVWRAVSAGLHAEQAGVRDACCDVLRTWGFAAVGLEQVITTLMAAPAGDEIVHLLVGPSGLLRALDADDPQRVRFAARHLAAVDECSPSEWTEIAQRMRERAAELADLAARQELELLAGGIERKKPRRRANPVKLRQKPRRPSAKTTYYDGFREDVLAGNYDGAVDYVHMLTSGDWARLEAEYASFPDGSLPDLIAILGHGPAPGLRILAPLLRGDDPQRARAAAAIATMAETSADDMAISSSEAAALERSLPKISPELASIIQRAVPDAELAVKTASPVTAKSRDD